MELRRDIAHWRVELARDIAWRVELPRGIAWRVELPRGIAHKAKQEQSGNSRGGNGTRVELGGN